MDGVRVASEPDAAHDEEAGGAQEGAWQEVPDDSLLVATVSTVRTVPLVHRRREDPHRMTVRFDLTRRLPDGYFADALHTDVLKGLTGRPKALPPKWFYDARGSELFEEITQLPEYYPTRAEHEILRERCDEIAAATGARTLVELGSGSSRKTRLLLDSLLRQGTLERYAALDVSADALREAGEALCRDYPGLRVTGCVTDLETDLGMPAEARGPRLVAFLGGTLGNLDGEARPAFYARTARVNCGRATPC